MLAALERERRLAQQLTLADLHRERLRLDDGPPAARRIDEAEAEPPRSARQQRDLLADLRLLLREAADLRQLRLGLLRLRLLVAEARDEALEPRDVLRVARGLLRRRLQARRLLEPPLVPRAGEVRRAARLELEHGGRRRLEEPAVVRDEDDACVEGRQLVLEPLEARDVEVVRRLVEQQQVRVAAERARERRARQLAAGERVEQAVEIRLAEAEAARDRADALAPVVAAGVLEPRLRLRVAAERLRAVLARRHRLLQLPQLLLDRDEVGGAGEDVIAQRHARASAAGAGRGARRACPFENASSPPCTSLWPASMRSSVVLPAPFGPASATRSRRSTLKETPSKSTFPASSLRRFEAITTAMRKD